MALDFPTRYPEYLVAAMVIILAPGPSVLFIIARAIAWGRATAVATVAGNVTGAFTLSLMVAFGLGPILQRSELAFIAVQLLGGFYLIYLGIDAIRNSKIHAADMVNQGDLKPSPFTSVKDGFWVGALNPKGLVFFAAILPQFIDKGSSNVTAQLVLMGATFSILAFFSDGTWGLIAGTVREWIATTPGRLVTMRRIGGLVMITLGVFTLISAL
ncbi:MAG: LysE family translocator [Candidatus Nanopelagicaceae bacterium]|nr:LysE family translocator [Candidatus Nanopelagicaceae bacterium]